MFLSFLVGVACAQVLLKVSMLDILPQSVPRHLASSESKPGIGVFVAMVHEDGVLDAGNLEQVIQSKAVGFLIRASLFMKMES